MQCDPNLYNRQGVNKSVMEPGYLCAKLYIIVDVKVKIY